LLKKISSLKEVNKTLKEENTNQEKKILSNANIIYTQNQKLEGYELLINKKKNA